MPVIRARDQRDAPACGCARDRGSGADVLVERPIARGRDDDHLRCPYELERHVGAPVERHLGRRRVVAAEGDADDGQSVFAERGDDLLRELAIGLVLSHVSPP